MAKIHILESNVYNQIAAGEVIENTASIIKELVENSIDAKATQITIKIRRGGKDFIQVLDNGVGIEKSELPAAFLPHATSKIACAEDLQRITTLGFRGEALASIASVAKMEICSKYCEADMAYSLSCAGGQIGSIAPTALNIGTAITIKDLFYNTPVRAKFLKTDKGEESEITACVTKFMLGHPDIAFLYQVDGKNKLQTYGDGLEEMLVAIYGKNTIDECIAIDAQNNNLHIRGYIGKPNFTKANRTYQITFINGRFVVNNTIQMAMHKAYESYIMKRQYPFYLLFIDVPLDEVDVNVHPRKTDVRFSNGNVIFHTIYKIISSILDGTSDAVNFIANNAVEKLETKNNVNIAIPRENIQIESMQERKEQIQAKEDRFEALDRINQKYENFEKENKLNLLLDKISGIDKNTLIFSDSKKVEQKESAIESQKSFLDRQSVDGSTLKRQFSVQKEQQKIFLEQAIYIGSIFQTYLLYVLEHNFYIIDQHAAHERLLFDRFCAKVKDRQILKQSMLVPYIAQANAEEGFFIEENMDCLQELGFEISKFGENSFRVESVASDLVDIDLKQFFTEIFSRLGEFKGIQFVDIFKEKIAMMACKSAVKGGQLLTQTEVDALFDMLSGDIGLKCPHGRPIAIRFTKTEIEKLFKRIV